MGVSPQELRRVAELAALGLDEAELTGLGDQLNRILEHMRALETAVADLAGEVGAAGEAPLRPDEPAADPLAVPPARMAPAWDEGFFTVPRLASHEDSDAGPGSATGPGL